MLYQISCSVKNCHWAKMLLLDNVTLESSISVAHLYLKVGDNLLDNKIHLIDMSSKSVTIDHDCEKKNIDL